LLHQGAQRPDQQAGVIVEAEARRAFDTDDRRLATILGELLETTVADLSLADHQRDGGALIRVAAEQCFGHVARLEHLLPSSWHASAIASAGSMAGS
jgi:hypothetical protein